MNPAACYRLCLGGTIILLLALGCSDNNTQSSRAAQTSHLRTLISLYNAASAKVGRPPANEAELRQFVQDNGAQVLARLNIESVDELLKSERDGQPFVVGYAQQRKGSNPDIVAYEQTGIDGKRQVGFRLGVIEEVDSQRFSELVPEVTPAP